MFTNLNEFFGGKSLDVNCEGAANCHDLQVSVVVLCSALAHADGEFECPEISSITGILYRELGLADHKAGELMEIANFLVNDKAKLDKFIEIINTKFSAEQKQLLLSVLWKVTMADNTSENQETKLIAELRHKLGLSIEQGVRARKLAEIDQINSLALKFSKPEA